MKTNYFTFFGLEDKEQSKMKDYYNIESGLSPIIKWSGGKEKELKYIIPNNFTLKVGRN